MFEKVVIIDARGHLLGRLASVVAKEALMGQVCVNLRAALSLSLQRNVWDGNTIPDAPRR